MSISELIDHVDSNFVKHALETPYWMLRESAEQTSAIESFCAKMTRCT